MNLALFVNNVRIDLDAEADVRLTYAIESSRDVGELTSGFSTTFFCPATPNNQQAFGHLDNLEVGEGNRYRAQFDRRRKQPARIDAQGVTVFRGECILERTRPDGFEVYVSGQDAPWKVSLDRPLREILAEDYSGLHTWQANDALVQRYNDGSREGDKWIVPIADYGRLQAQLTTGVAHLEDLQPWAFVRQVLRRCFVAAGYTQADDFFDRADASGLLLGAGEFKHVEGQPFDDLPNGLATIVRGASDGDNDNVGGYPLATNATSSAIGGTYSIYGEFVKVKMRLWYTRLDSFYQFGATGKGLQFALYRASDVDPSTNYWFGRLIVKQVYRFFLGSFGSREIYVHTMGTPTELSRFETLFGEQIDPATGWYFIDHVFTFRAGLEGATSSEFFPPFRQATANVWADYVPVISAGQVTNGTFTTPGTFAFDGTPDATFQIRRCEFSFERAEEQDYTVKVGQAFREVSVLPAEMTGLELLAEVAKMFNLLVETDPVRKTVKLLTRDEFYRTTLGYPALDWSAKVNLDEPYESVFLDTEHPTRLDFKFADAADADTEALDARRITPIGAARWDSEGEVGDDPDEIELETPALTEFTYTVGSPVTHRIVAARIAPEPSPASVEPEPDNTVRIAQLCTHTGTGVNDVPVRLITRPGYVGDLVGTTTYGNVPTVRALSSPNVGDFVDTATRVSRVYQALRWGDTTAFRGLLRYYTRQLERVKTGRKLTVSLVLGIADMVAFSFRRAVKVLNQVWDVERINQFDPTQTASTEVDLVTHIDVPPPGYGLAQAEFLFEQTTASTAYSLDFRVNSETVNIGPLATAVQANVVDALTELQQILRAAGLIAYCWQERAYTGPVSGLYRVRVGFPQRPVNPELVCRLGLVGSVLLPRETILTPYG